MKTEEVEMAAKRSPHTTTLKDCIIFQAGVEWANEYHKNNPDEYTEETLREYCSWAHWCATGVRPDHETVQQNIDRLKESLKK